MLGLRREAVTVAAGRLQDVGLIQYSLGHTHILDRQILEAAGCECYRVVEQEVNARRSSPRSPEPSDSDAPFKPTLSEQRRDYLPALIRARFGSPLSLQAVLAPLNGCGRSC